MRALVIDNGQVTEKSIQNTLEALQKEVGGYIATAFTCQRPGSDTELTGYVNDEGLLFKIPIRSVVAYPNGVHHPMAGPMVIVGVDHAGETIGLTPEDVSYLQDRCVHEPVYVYNGEYVFTDVVRIPLP